MDPKDDNDDDNKDLDRFALITLPNWHCLIKWCKFCLTQCAFWIAMPRCILYCFQGNFFLGRSVIMRARVNL